MLRVAVAFCGIAKERTVVQAYEFPDLIFTKLQDAVADVMVARDAVADIFLEEFERGVFSHALRHRVRNLLDARERLDEAVLAYSEVGTARSRLRGPRT